MGAVVSVMGVWSTHTAVGEVDLVGITGLPSASRVSLRVSSSASRVDIRLWGGSGSV